MPQWVFLFYEARNESYQSLVLFVIKAEIVISSSVIILGPDHISKTNLYSFIKNCTHTKTRQFIISITSVSVATRLTLTLFPLVCYIRTTSPKIFGIHSWNFAPSDSIHRDVFFEREMCFYLPKLPVFISTHSCVIFLTELQLFVTPLFLYNVIIILHHIIMIIHIYFHAIVLRHEHGNMNSKILGGFSSDDYMPFLPFPLSVECSGDWCNPSHFTYLLLSPVSFALLLNTIS